MWTGTINKKTHTVSIAVIIWSILKILRGVSGIVQDGGLIESVLKEFDSMEDTNELLNILFLFMCLICDIVPVLIVLDSTILNAFTIEAIEQENMLEWQLLPSEYNEDEESVSPNPFTRDYGNRLKTLPNNMQSPGFKMISMSKSTLFFCLDQLASGVSNGRATTDPRYLSVDHRYRNNDKSTSGKPRTQEDMRSEASDNSRTQNWPNVVSEISLIKRVILKDKSAFVLGKRFIPKNIHEIDESTKFGKYYYATLNESSDSK